MNSCVLCKDMPCCPEHCCNWDECECGDCDACMPKTKIQPQQPKPILQEPVKIILLGNHSSAAPKNPIKEELKENTSQSTLESEYKSEKNSVDEKIEKNPKKSSFDEEEHKISKIHSPKAVGNGIFGIRYLRNKK